jgi:hypothetical protein
MRKEGLDFDGRFWQNETTSNFGLRRALCAALFFFLTSSCLHAFIRDEHAALPVEKAQIAQLLCAKKSCHS